MLKFFGGVADRRTMEHITHIIVVHPSYHKFSESSVECIQDDLARGATISTAGSMLGGKVTFD